MQHITSSYLHKMYLSKKMKPIGQIKLVIVSWQAEMVVGDLKEAFIIV